MNLIKIPNLGVMVENIRIVEWCKKVDEEIKKNDILLRVETEKAIFEVEAEADGVLGQVFVKEGESVPANSIIGIIVCKGEVLPDKAQIFNMNKVPGAPSKILTKKSPVLEKKQLTSVSLISATPKARAIAREIGLDLKGIKGSCPGGIITAKDVYNCNAGARLRIAIVNAGKGGRLLYESASGDESLSIVGFIDDDPSFKGKIIEGLPVLGTVGDFIKLKKNKMIEGVYVAIGNSIKSRAMVAAYARKCGLKLISVIDKKSIVSRNAKIGTNVWIKEGAIIGLNCIIGNNVIVDSGCILSHDITVSENCHLSPGCKFGGTVFVGKNTIIGVGASISPYIKIGSGVIITPGSSVVHDIPDWSIIEGTPGKVIGSSRKERKVKI